MFWLTAVSLQSLVLLSHHFLLILLLLPPLYKDSYNYTGSLHLNKDSSACLQSPFYCVRWHIHRFQGLGHGHLCETIFLSIIVKERFKINSERYSHRIQSELWEILESSEEHTHHYIIRINDIVDRLEILSSET